MSGSISRLPGAYTLNSPKTVHTILNSDLEQLVALVSTIATAPFGGLRHPAGTLPAFLGGNAALLSIQSGVQMLAARAFTAETALLSTRSASNAPGNFITEHSDSGHSTETSGVGGIELWNRVEGEESEMYLESLRRRCSAQWDIIRLHKNTLWDPTQLVVRVITDHDFRNHQGFDLVMPLNQGKLSFDTMMFKILREETPPTFRDRLVEHFRIPRQQIRLWVLIGRLNHTFRPYTAIEGKDFNFPLEKIRRERAATRNDMCLYMEILPVQPDRRLLALELDHILLFFKYFNAEEQTVSGAFRILLDKKLPVFTLRTAICERMYWRPDVKICIYEEMQLGKIARLYPSSDDSRSLEGCELETGDIICFSIDRPVDEIKVLSDQGLCATAPEMYELIQHQVPVRFEPRFDGDGKSFRMNLRKDMSYEQFALAVAKPLLIEATNIRFFTSNAEGYPSQWNPYHTVQKLIQPLYGMPQLALIFYEIVGAQT
ncbi:hypothetical protein FRB94_012091 [Tulasnella sp. JGI-2019a]|nr:hypothetical protein FRB93_003332 [Tulasnella sp. JGI-2019a]KAG8992004.1 hypothetical protein FRB94_012091 [Tulasnella sp. JGI-2019a]